VTTKPVIRWCADRWVCGNYSTTPSLGLIFIYWGEPAKTPEQAWTNYSIAKYESYRARHDPIPYFNRRSLLLKQV
jgi:hypothetical protein